MAGNPPPEFFREVPLRPGEQLQGYLPNLFSLVIPIQGGRNVRMDEVKYNMVERATDLVVTDQRMVGYKWEQIDSPFRREFKFYPRFGLDVEKAQEIKVKDIRLEVLGPLTGMGICTLYILTGSSREAEGLAQWLEAAKQRRIEALQAIRPGPPPPNLVANTNVRRTAGGWDAPPPPPPR